MNDQLDRTVRSVLADIVATTPPLSDLPERMLPVEGPARNRRPVFAIAAAVIVVVGIGAGLFAMSRQSSDAPPADSSPLIPNEFDRLLYPAGMDVSQVYVTASPGNRAGAVIISPDGLPFAVSVMENFWGALPADQEQREVNGRTFGAGAEMGSVSYTTLASCVMVSMGERVPDDNAWSADALTALNGLTIDGTDVTLQVPAGWTAMGSGALGAMYSVSFSTSDGRSAFIDQLLDAPAGALLAQRGITAITTTTVAGQPAWLYGDDQWTFLAWNRAEGSAVLGLEGGTAEELVALAERLATQHGSDWSHGLADAAFGTGSPATVATTADVPGQCATRTLTILP